MAVMNQTIKRLSEGTINRIAAGEVIERPASVVKELVENAIDAGATAVDVVFRGGGKSLIRVSDNGSGMDAADLGVSIERHATSKLADDMLTDIQTLGFRGEALPSIGSVARLTIVTRATGDAHELRVEAGRLTGPAPAARKRGTDVEVRDLFYATPARLKFLKSDRSEIAEAVDVVRRLALANPAIGFSFASEDRRWLDVPAGEEQLLRVERVMGADFKDNAVAFSHGGEDVVVAGYAGLPTAARGQAVHQFAFVNGRPVRDKLISGAIRGAYADVLPPGRYPAVVLYLSCAPQRVDVNVHPAKTEVRFRDSGFVRGLIVSAIRRALATRPAQADHTLSRAFAETVRPPTYRQPADGFSDVLQTAFEMQMPPGAKSEAVSPDTHYPLGAARAQVHENFIIAQTDRGMVVVDQHAAHERIVYERLKAEHRDAGIAIQPLLVPQVVELDTGSLTHVLALVDVLAQAGLHVESFGDSAVLVREVPAALATADVAGLLRDVADDADTLDQLETVATRIDHVLATFACHHSVRSGRLLNIMEMNALLREIERTPNGGECNHGRPTFVEFSLKDIERLFRRR
jgi:DNA mismatch repair protein MutL